MSVEVRRIQTADFILWILIAVTLFFYPAALDVFNFPKQWVLICFTAGMFAHFIIGGRGRRNSSYRHTRLLLFLVIATAITMTFSALATETTFTRSVFGYPGRANGLLTYFCILLIVLVGALTKLPEDFQAKALSRIIFVFGIVALYALLQFFKLDPVPWNNPYNPIIGTLGNPNFSGAFLGVASVVILGVATQSKQKKKIALLIFSLALLFLAESTKSVQALGIFTIGLGMQLLIWAFRKLNYKKFIGLLVLTILSGVFGLISLLGYGPLGQTLFQYTLRLRLEYWRIGVDIARSFPFTGVGPDSYVEGFRLFRGSDFVGKYSDTVIADSAHNVLINFMANYGVLAIISYLAIIILVTMKAISALFTKETTPSGTYLLALSWILLLIQSLFSLEQIGLNVFQWCCGALLLNPGIVNFSTKDKPTNQVKLERKVGEVTRGLTSEASFLIIILIMISSWSFMKQEVSLQQLYAIPAGTKLSDLEIDAKTSTFNSFTLNEIRRANYLADFLLRTNKVEETKSLMENIVMKDPDAYEALEQLALIARFKSDIQLELSYREKIVRIDPFNYSNFLALAQGYKAVSNLSKSSMYAKRVLYLSKDQAINESATAILSASK